MADPTTPNRGLRLPALGKKPWKSDWDFNFEQLDGDIGDILRGTLTVGEAASIQPGALTPFITSVSGDLGAISVPDGEIQEFSVDHSVQVRFDIPAEPIFIVPAGVTIVLLGNRSGLTFDAYGGTFQVRVENFSGSSLSGASVNWQRKGWKITT